MTTFPKLLLQLGQVTKSASVRFMNRVLQVLPIASPIECQSI